MKLIIGLFLVASAIAYPLGESEEKPHEPLVISDSYSSVSKSEEVKHDLEKSLQHDASASSSSEESAESSEKTEAPSTQPPAAPLKDEPKEAKKEEKKLEEPAKLEEVPKPEEPKLEAKKPEEPLPELKKIEVPQVKALEPEKKEKIEPAKVEEKTAEKSIIHEEKPLAKIEEKSAAASQIKEEIVALQSEQKVEVPVAAEEKAPELKTTIAEEKKDLEPIPEKKAKSDDKLPAPAPVTAAATDLPNLTSEEPKPVSSEAPKPAVDQVAYDAKPVSDEKVVEKVPEAKSAEPGPIKEEPKPENQKVAPVVEEKPASSS